MHGPQGYKPPLDTELSRRKRAGWWFIAFLAVGFSCGSAAYSTTFRASHPWLMFWSVMALFVVGAVTSNLQLRAALDLRGMYEMLLKDYEESYNQGAKRGKFMIEFTPPRETVETVLRSQAYRVLQFHRQIVELHEKGVEVPVSGNPEIQLYALKRNFDEKAEGLELLMQQELKQFRELRDLAAWAGESRFKVRKSWWDYIDDKDLPESVRKSRRLKNEATESGDCISTPIDTSTSDLARARQALEPAHEGLIRPHPFRRSSTE